MEKHITYISLDVHKEAIAVALADEGMRGDMREHGKIANTSLEQAVQGWQRLEVLL